MYLFINGTCGQYQLVVACNDPFKVKREDLVFFIFFGHFFFVQRFIWIGKELLEMIRIREVRIRIGQLVPLEEAYIEH